MLSDDRPTALAVGRPPGPRGRPLVGTLYDHDKDPAGYLDWCRDTYGDIFSLTPYHVVVCRPDWTQRILARTGREFQFASHGKSTRESFMTHRVAEWLSARRSASHYLTGSAADVIAARLELGMEQLARQRAIGVPDLQRLAAFAALPCYVHDGDDRFLRKVVEADVATQSITSSSLTLPRWASLARRRWQHAVDDLIGDLVQRTEARRADNSAGSPPRDVLDLLASEEDLTSLQAAQFIATATTNVHAVGGTALSWLLVQIDRHPEVTDPAADDPDWPQAVIKETLRMYPPIWSVRREVGEAAEVGGFLIEPGMTMVVSLRMLHYDRRWWNQDPAVFSPERWTGGRQPHQSHAYIPYGAGPRVCSGAAVGQAILTGALSVVANRWRVIVDTPETKPLPGAVVIPDPLRLRLISR